MPIRRKTAKRAFKRRAFKKKAHRRRKATTLIMFKPSKSLHQPLPDRYFTWMSCDNQGYWGAGSSQFTQMQLCLNTIWNPFDVTAGGSPTKLPNPLTATNALAPCGTENLLYNTTTNTGLYNQYRVWGCRATVTISPQSNVDACNVAMAPTNSSRVYGTFTTLAQGPGAISKMIVIGANGRSNTMSKYYRIYELLGIPKRDYSALSTTTSGFFNLLPTSACFLNIAYQEADQTTITDNLPIFIRLQYFVEFFQRVDTGLLDA